METLNRAIEITERMRDALAAEVARAREQRLLIRKLDSAKLFERAQLRAQFNATLAQLEAELAAELAEVGQRLGLREVSIDVLRTRNPGEARKLAESFAQVRALAAALSELDALNRQLAARALSCVRGYVNALTGPANAYDRRGMSTARSTLYTSSRTA
ncbi:MAG TPA: flagellar export chaperone FlgN [Polyangia bacterium]|nr:flagellar export chaperone FlgN [Polyangia bacterium]